MTAFILGMTAFLTGTAIGGLALVVIGIRKGDRAIRLADNPSTRTEAFARRFLGVGIRTAVHSDDEGGEL
jgi:hypothetical protein